MTRIEQNATRLLRGLFAFRLSIALFAALLLYFIEPAGVIVGALQAPARTGWLMLPTLLTTIFLFVPGLERRLGRWYLPAGLAAAIVSFSLEFGAGYIEPGIQVVVTLRSGWQLSQYWSPTEAILLALAPCVLASAVYGVEGAAKASSLATLIHLGLGIAFWRSGAPLHGFLAFLPLRVAVLYGFPLIAGLLVDTWRREHDALEEANRQLRGHAATVEQLATSRERVRLARDLHDTLAHTLSALVVQVEAVEALQAQDPASALSRLERVKQQARVGLAEARQAILDLRSSPVEELGLPGALAQLAAQFERRHGLAAGFDTAGQPLSLPAAETNALYRIAEEALENVARHALASRVRVTLHYPSGGENREELVLAVQDDGRGFDPGQELEAGRLGLVGIYERAALVGGRVEVGSAPEEGTAVTIRIPLPAGR